MTKKITKFGVVINDNPKAITLYAEQKALLDEVKELESQVDENFTTYMDMEGKYSSDIVNYAEMGYRGYSFKYPNKETKDKEIKERETYYLLNIEPLKVKIKELRTMISDIDEKLCFAIFGYGKEQYRLRHNLQVVKEEYQECLKHIEELKEEIARLEKEIEEKA